VNPNGKTIPRQSVVIATGKFPDGRTVSQQLTLPHEPGVTEVQLISAAINLVRASGGLINEGEKGTIDFYPLLMFTGGINFSVQRVSLALGTLAMQ